MQMTECWKSIAGYEGRYEVSTLGRIRSLARVVAGPYGNRRLNGRIIAQAHYNGPGRERFLVRLWRDNHSVFRLVHVLVARAFIPNPLNLPEVNHKKGMANVVENLEWRSKQGNTLHAVQHNLGGKGFHFDKSRNKWRVYAPIRIIPDKNGRRRKFIGRFDTYEAAKAARDAAILTLEEVL